MLEAIGRRLRQIWPRAPWYAGRLGQTIHSDGCTFTLPNRYLAGVMRLGGYEVDERRAVRSFLPRDLPLVELGAGLGIVACVANRLLTNPSNHLCVDGNPLALAGAKAHGEVNGCRFSTLHAALAYDTQTVKFGIDEHIQSGGIDSGHRTVTVPAVTLADLFARTGFARCSLICDIEGAEQAMIAREGQLMQARVALLILETHPGVYGAAGETEIDARLSTLGYLRQWRRQHVTVWRNSSLIPHV